MESWNNIKNIREKIPGKQIKFLNDIEKVCKKYNLSISHEDPHGAFKIEKYSEENIEWLKHAHINW